MNKKICYWDELKKEVVATVEDRDGKLFLKYTPGRKRLLVDPSLPEGFEGYLSDWQIDGLVDRLPVNTNPRYPEYCIRWEISKDETDILTLLCTLGHRSTSAYVCKPVGWEPLGYGKNSTNKA